MILLTAFGPFPGITHNASADLVLALSAAAVKRFPKRRIVAHVFPTEWSAAPKQLAELYRTHAPILSLHFGVSDRAKSFSIETQACNTQSMAPDAANKLPPSHIISARGADTLPVTIDAQHVAIRLDGLGVPASISHSAGTYLCNSVLYRSLELAHRQTEPGLTGFVHMPVAFSDAGFSFETAVTGGLEIIRACLGLPPPRTSLTS